MSIEPQFQDAYRAIQEGRLDEARGLLQGIVKRNPHDAHAWFLLSGTTLEPYDVAYCLRNTLHLDSCHSGAKTALRNLKQQLDKPPVTVMQVDSSLEVPQKVCPYCLSDSWSGEEMICCPDCQIAYHYECWGENHYRCGTWFCRGFSLCVNRLDPLPGYSAASAMDSQAQPSLEIHKNDIGKVQKVTRKVQEQQFQRRMLFMALLAEQGEISEEAGDSLPSVSELLYQIHRDRETSEAEEKKPDYLPNPHEAPDVPKTGIDPSHGTPASYQRSSAVKEAVSVEHPGQGNPFACKQCHRQFHDNQSRFCAECGTPRW